MKDTVMAAKQYAHSLKEHFFHFPNLLDTNTWRLSVIKL